MVGEAFKCSCQAESGGGSGLPHARVQRRGEERKGKERKALSALRGKKIKSLMLRTQQLTRVQSKTEYRRCHLEPKKVLQSDATEDPFLVPLRTFQTRVL